MAFIAAPAGYGKTTTAMQWSERVQSAAAWLTLDRADDDPTSLLQHLQAALREAGLMGPPSEDRRLSSDEILTHGLWTVLSAVESSGRDGVLFLDQFEQVRSEESRDVLSGLMLSLPPNLNVVVATRSTDGLPLALLRSRGFVSEIGPDELAMDETEVRELFDHIGVDLPDGPGEVLERTEGWPAALYLVALAMKTAKPQELLDVRGDDRFIADYLRDEVLGGIADSRWDFLVKSSVLSRLSGPLCDHVLERGDSAHELDEMESSNMLLIPLDRTRTWFRFHSLLSDLLRSELGIHDHGLAVGLHSRASVWLEDNGEIEEAIEHAMAAGEEGRVAAMVAGAARATYGKGKVETLSGWMTWLERRGVMRDQPELAAIGSFLRSLEGDALGADQLSMVVEAVEEQGPLALMLRSFRCAGGHEQALDDARSALELIDPRSEWTHTVMGAEALALGCMGAFDAADSVWAEAAKLAGSLPARPFESTALAERALIAIERGNWSHAEDLVERSLATIIEGRLDRYITSALTFVLSSRLAARRGHIDEAGDMAGRMAALRPRLTAALPVLSVQVLIEMAKAYVELADIAGARRVMREAGDIIALRPRLGSINHQYEAMRDRLSALPAGEVGPSSLTTAELRLLPLLVTHLTYPEIGERLFISRHTVKTQAMSIYRKLGVSSRSAAVDRARSVGLLSL
ncbi:MAG TPA: LuxR C-terminal-related transcriptional regulator [Acidimicrobiia bacterium]|nr:LuxR C-terminal-related transcriptional regulator [Acidimicrobiia bacterium]